jgi:predicted component of type VI protein secretion system
MPSRTAKLLGLLLVIVGVAMVLLSTDQPTRRQERLQSQESALEQLDAFVEGQRTEAPSSRTPPHLERQLQEVLRHLERRDSNG